MRISTWWRRRISTRFENTPPAAVLVGLDNDDAAEEEPLLAYAHRRGYVPVALPDDGTLWLQPQARWGGAIVLGGHDLPRDPVHPGDSFVLTLYLQNKVVHTHNLSILVRLVDDQGHELLRDEGWPYGSPTTSWQPGVVWPDGHEFTVPADAAPGYYRVEVSFYDPADKAHLGDVATIGYLAVTPDAAADAGDDAPALAQYGGAIALRTATVMETAVRAGDTVQVDTTWQALAPIASDLTAFLHVLDREGRLVAQHDGAPGRLCPHQRLDAGVAPGRNRGGRSPCGFRPRHLPALPRSVRPRDAGARACDRRRRRRRHGGPPGAIEVGE
ncbi:MAG: hypothetical protein R3A10_19855 [Caldilineaceae bacterium]